MVRHGPDAHEAERLVEGDAGMDRVEDDRVVVTRGLEVREDPLGEAAAAAEAAPLLLWWWRWWLLCARKGEWENDFCARISPGAWRKRQNYFSDVCNHQKS